MGYKLRSTLLLSELAARFGFEWCGADIVIEGVAALRDVGPSEIAFGVDAYDIPSHAVVITTDDLSRPDIGCVKSSNPRRDFIIMLNWLNDEIGFVTWQSESRIATSARLGRNVIVEDGCVVGPNSIVEHNVVLHSGTRIGANCRIRSGSSIGGDGFGFERLIDGVPLRFPHLGGVVIGDNVEIGSLNSIARGTLSDTVIQDHVKTDNLVHIAHNCSVGASCLIAACAELSGGVVLAEKVWVGPNSTFLQKVKVGTNSFVGLGSVVTKDIPDNVMVAGSPARRIRDVE